MDLNTRENIRANDGETTNPLDVVVVGNVGIDTNVYLPGRDIDFGIEANFTENSDCVGQAGGYSARGFAQLGAATAFVGYVGDDYHGEFVRKELTRDGIDTEALFVDPAGTSRSVNLMYPDGRRRNFYDGKSHMQLKPDLALCREVLSRVRLAHFHIPNWARLLLPIAREQGVSISCDLQDVVALDDAYRRDFVEASDILFFSVVNQDSPTALMEKILARYPAKICVAGMGANGCALGTSAGIRSFDAVELAAPVIDTNGAGDSLAVGFLSSYILNGFSFEDAILRGQIAARHTCTLKADSSNLITMKRLNEVFKSMKHQEVNYAS